MITLSDKKKERMDRIAASDGFIKALAIDQRGSMEGMFRDNGEEPTKERIEELKKIVSEELTVYASSILLDPLYGIPGAHARNEEAGLLLSYETTGFRDEDRLPKVEDWLSIQRLVHEGADAVKILLYYDPNDSEKVNEIKHAFVERIGSEAENEDLPFYLEIITYQKDIKDMKGAEFAKLKPAKVIASMKEFSKPHYKVDVLKMETPVNMNFVEGFAKGEVVYSKEEALQAFKEQSEATTVPYIFLSAGVSAELFQDTLKFAKEAGAKFHGVLCGRATWRGVVEVFVKEGEEAAREWLRTTGKENIETLNEIVEASATPWTEMLEQ